MVMVFGLVNLEMFEWSFIMAKVLEGLLFKSFIGSKSNLFWDNLQKGNLAVKNYIQVRSTLCYSNFLD